MVKLAVDMPPGNPVESPVEEPIGRMASFDPVDSGLSMSMPITPSPPLFLLWRRCRFEDTATGRDIEEAPGPGLAFGGAAAIGTTPLPPEMPLVEGAPPKWLLGVLPAVFAPDVGALTGLSPSLLLEGRLDAGGVVAMDGWWLLLLLFLLLFAVVVDMDNMEFLRDVIALMLFLDLVLVPPTGRFEPEPRFLFLITSVFRLSGRTTPCSFKKRPQALHSGCPSGFRRHRGVVWVKQLVHVVGAFPSLPLPAAACRLVVEPCFEPGGEQGRLGATEEKPDMVSFPSPEGETGIDWASCSNPLCFPARCAGVEAFLTSLCCLFELPDLKDCEWDLFSPFPSHSLLAST